ncbi:MAG TPA: RNA polymerase sigma factor [Bacteroidota bacterium]|nr:RNA polymerase sigma factor [Bacteroidota bacterium]
MDVIEKPDEVRGDRAGEGGRTGALVTRWRSGEPDAFREIVDEFRGPLLSYAFSILRHLQDAEDVVQETLMRAHTSVHQLREAASVWGWLKRIAHNAAMDAARTSARRGTPTDPSVLGEINDGIAGEGSEGQEAVISLETIVSAIESLPETYRQAAIHHYLQEWPYTKIALSLGIDAATARQRISRAGKMLRSALCQHRDTEDNDM